MLCRKFKTIRFAVSGSAMEGSLPYRAWEERAGNFRRPSWEAACKLLFFWGQMAAIVSSMETSSPTVSPSTATLTEGTRPMDSAQADTMYTQPTRAVCSRSWAPAGIPAFFMP